MSTLNAFRMDGRRAVVTGAAGLLGREFVAGLLDAGAHVAMLDAREEALAQTLQWLPAEQRARASTFVCDITNEQAVATTVSAIAEAGEIHALVNSAAIDPKFEPDASGAYADDGRFPTYSLDNWMRSLQVNLTGTFLLTKAVCREMEKTGNGAVVMISSTYGLTGPDQRIYERSDGGRRFWKPVDYSATKAGVLGLSRAIAAYYRGTKIRVNALTPGGAYNGHDPEFTRNYSDRTILGRMAEPAEYRAAIVFLCSDASSYMTGSNLVIDGGWSAL